jgi:hypothetical protein
VWHGSSARTAASTLPVPRATVPSIRCGARSRKPSSRHIMPVSIRQPLIRGTRASTVLVLVGPCSGVYCYPCRHRDRQIAPSVPESRRKLQSK